jgi:hypothetical protein
MQTRFANLPISDRPIMCFLHAWLADKSPSSASYCRTHGNWYTVSFPLHLNCLKWLNQSNVTEL